LSAPHPSALPSARAPAAWLGGGPAGSSGSGLAGGPAVSAGSGLDGGLLAAWARRLAATEVQLHELAVVVRLAVAGTTLPAPSAAPLTELADRAAAEVAALGRRAGRAGRLLAAEAVRLPR
jgi:hypothetical protein